MMWSAWAFPLRPMDLSTYSIVPEADGPCDGLYGLEHINESNLKSIDPAFGTSIQYMGLAISIICGACFYWFTELRSVNVGEGLMVPLAKLEAMILV